MILFYNTKNNNASIVTRKTQDNRRKLITFSTCWYILKSKFPIEQYLKWIKNFLSIVNNFYLVIYTNRESFVFLSRLIDRKNKNIKIIIKPIEEFYTYKYKELWIKNHKMSNMDLHEKIDWELNMLWNEKVFLVQETIQNNYFSTMYYGWCDIGYFRNRPNDLNSVYLNNWPNNEKLLNKNFKNICIHYGSVQNDTLKYWKQIQDIKSHYDNNLNTNPINNYNESSFAGGFFILPKFLSNYYANLYDNKLNYYFSNGYFIKDDQIIVMDIIFTNEKLFHIHREYDKRFDNWFMFQRLLL
jgi:hypothetical protein